MTAIKHDDNKPAYNLIPPQPLREVAEIMGHGAQKYSPHNYREGEGLRRDRVRAALMRHVEADRAGELLDPETGLPHLTHAICCALMVRQLQIEGKGGPDEWAPDEQPKPASKPRNRRKK